MESDKPSAATIPEAPITSVDSAAAKSKNQDKNEAKRRAKMEKFLAKQSKIPQDSASSAPSTKKKASKPPAPTKKSLPKIDFIPGQKKDLSEDIRDSYEPSLVESVWYDWWVKEKYFEPKFTEDGQILPAGKFVVAIPPPNVTGKLHIGHALGVSIQDCLARWNRMKGLTVLLNPGSDHAGISTQSVVEKKLWQNGKVTRHDLGRDEFIKKVWEWKDEYGSQIGIQKRRLGGSYDWSRERFTLDEQLSKAVAETFVRLWDEGIMYRARRLVNWCVYFNTALSNLEVENIELSGKTYISVPGYDEKVQFGVLVLFNYQVEGSDEKITVATTRVETMLADTAVAVHPDDDRYKHLHGKFVIHPFNNRRIPIITDSEAVDPQFGTGAVKITPAHDFNDYEVGNRHNLEFINILNDDGTFNENAGRWKGSKRFDVRKEIIKELESLGLLVDIKSHAMTIPVCSKSKDVIEPVIKPQWYVSCETLAKPAMDAVTSGELQIIPKVSEGDWFRWLGKINDWCVSRQLWWGHRIPAYFVNIDGENCSIDDSNFWVCGRDENEAKQRASAKFPGKTFVLEQDPDVLDTWFSSGLWPFSIFGWPEETLDFQKLYPTTLNETGWDILFFWVARMVMLGLHLTGKLPFTKVFCHAMIRDAQGRKMSKSLGNVIDPIDVIEGISLQGLHDKLMVGNLDPKELKIATTGQQKDFPNGIPECGVDALRFAMCAYTSTGRDLNLDVLRIEGYRKFCNKIWNATRFALLKLGPEFSPSSKQELTGNESAADKWILNKLNFAVTELNRYLTEMNFMAATSAVYSFWLYELCDVYIEYTKYVVGEKEIASSLNTLYTCLDQGLLMLHPFMPFITEELWQRLPRRAGDSTPSITIANFPISHQELSDNELSVDFDNILSVIKASRSLMVNYSINSNASLFVSCKQESEVKLYRQFTNTIVGMVKGCSSMNVLEPTDEVPAGCAISVISTSVNVLLLVKGQIDIEAEVGRLEKKISKTKELLDKLLSKTTAPGYEKTKPEVKENNNSKIQGYEEDIAAVSSVIESFKSLGI
ncbi:Valine-tRNA ligase, mitochondrial [Smittium mucronatum]|uniref:Probable valine--tRNA ligase, cytoplasmic n=1 Tax=Smittium mucronatum TaxID=133383 RepID=A0A1R0H6U3_9FUNG|nr:Valine-tRNA ligase, mitochondrial [Smittium mucronatum]